MASTSSTAAAVADTFRRGIEQRNAELLGSLYAEDCEHVQINRNAPPSQPIVVRGRAAITAIWRDDCARDIRHRIEASFGTGDQVAFRVTCQHPDGTLVATMMMAELRDGLIHRAVAIECWDE
jgi:hypothetical protein